MDEVTRHTSLGEMARECAEHRGTMIVDIDVAPDGHAHVHAVATWDDGSEEMGNGSSPDH